MSFKVYEAYRIKSGLQLFDVMASLRTTAQERVRNVLQTQYTETLKDPTWLEGLVPPNTNLEELTVRKIDLLFREQYGAQLSHLENSVWNFDLTLTIWEHKKRYYLVPHKPGFLLTNVLDFLQEDSQLEEYGYWDSSDRPKGVSPAAWRTRKKIWTHIKVPEQVARSLECSIVNYHNWNSISPWFEMAQKNSKCSET